MNGQDGLSRSVRGATEVVGIVVLVGMVVTSASLLFMFASEAQNDIRQEVQVEDGVRKVSDIDSAAADVSATAGGDRIDLGDISPSRVHVVDAGYLGIEMNAGSPGFDGSNPCSARVPLSAVVVEVSEDTDLVYFAGGIWRVDDSGATVQSPPEIGLDEDGTLEFTTYNFEGEFSGREVVVSEDSNASQRLSNRVQEEMVASEACKEQLDGNVENVSVTTAFEPTGGPSSATDAVSAVVPAYRQFVAEELDATTTTVDTGSGTAVGARLGGDALPGEADLGRNGVVDFAGDGPGEVTGGTVSVDKDADNEYPVRMTLLATDVRNVTQVERTVEVPVENEVGLDRQQRSPDYEAAPVDARRAVTGWDDVTFPGDVRTEAPDFQERTTELYRTTTEYEFQDVDASNAFEQYQDERVDAPEQDPLEVVFVIDESGSMRYPDYDTLDPSRLRDAQRAATKFIDILRTSASASDADGRSHRAAVVGFGAEYDNCGIWYDPTPCNFDEAVRLQQGLTEDLDAAEAGVDDLQTYRDTPLWDGVDVGIDQYAESGREDTNRIMVVLTDGKQNWDAEGQEPETDSDVQARIERAQENGITVYTVGTASDEDDVDAVDLQRIADQTGGNYTFVSDTGELEDVFDQIVRDEITSNVTVREPAPTQTVRMKVLPADEAFDGTVPTDGVLTEWDDRDVVIAPAGGAEQVSMADADAGVVRVHYADRNDTYFFLNGTDPTSGDASARGAAEVTPEGGDVVPEDPETREERVETDLDQTVEIAAYESEPDPSDEPAHDLQLQRNGNTLYLGVSEGDLQETDEDGRVKYVDDDGNEYYFDLTDDMVPDPGTTEQWVDEGDLPAPVDVQVLADGAETPDDADTVTVDGETIALRATGGWTLEQSPSVNTVFWLTDPSGDTTYRFDLSEDDAAEELPDREDTLTWQPVPEDERPTLEVIAAPSGDLPSDVESVVGEASVTVTEGGTTYLLRTSGGGDLASTADGFVLETGDEMYRFDESDVAALSETDATGWFPADDADVGLTVYDSAEAVPDDAEGYVVDLGDTVTVVDPETGWSDVTVSGTTLTYERAGTEYRLDVAEDDLPPVDERTDTETRIDRQVYSRPMTIDVSLGGETITTPWTDAESGLATDVTRVGATERDTVLTMGDGEALSFGASVYDCGPADRERTGGTVVIGGETYNRTACTTLDESSADPATVDLYTDGDTVPSDADAAPWQDGLRDALGSEHMDGDEVDVGDNQVVVVVEYDDASGASNYAVAIATIGDDAPDVAELLQIDVNQVEVEDDDED